MPLIAYLLTFSSYGTHLPGSEKGWVDWQHCMPGSPLGEPDPRLEADSRSRLNDQPWIMNQETRLLALRAILSVCTHRKWTAHAVHVRTNHVHAVISGEAKPEKILSDCKAYATRAFRSRTGEGLQRRYWTKHGSTRYLWEAASLTAAIEYVLHGQGAKMAYHSAECALKSR